MIHMRCTRRKGAAVMARYKNSCFAYSKELKRCTALKDFYAPKPRASCRGCPFYKTREQFERDRANAEERAFGAIGRRQLS